jgi:hypothetical protein
MTFGSTKGIEMDLSVLGPMEVRAGYSDATRAASKMRQVLAKAIGVVFGPHRAPVTAPSVVNRRCTDRRP